MFPIVKGKGGIIATVIADSISSWGKRLTTFEIVYPRFIHSEFMTHRLFSRNCASSRAIPSKKIFKLIDESPAVPIHWGKNQSGMQAYQELDQPIIYEESVYTPNELWHKAKSSSISYASALASTGYHKQITNRIVEPFQMIKAVVTATEYDNFYWLRNHHASQPEIKELGECMIKASSQSEPILRTRSSPIPKDEYHLPYVSNDERDQYSLDNCIKLAVARCAAVSYRNEDYQLEKSKQIYDRLIGDDRKHSSALEHIGRVMDIPRIQHVPGLPKGTYIMSYSSLEPGISQIDRDGFFWSGNFKGWIQYRKLIPEECCWEYHESQA